VIVVMPSLPPQPVRRARAASASLSRVLAALLAGPDDQPGGDLAQGELLLVAQAYGGGVHTSRGRKRPVQRNDLHGCPGGAVLQRGDHL
jgi:hypothetical protein